MTLEQRDQLIQVIEGALAQASGTTTENVYAFFAKAEPWVRNAADLLAEVKSRESLIALLDRLPAEYEAYIPAALRIIESIPTLAVKAAKETLKPAAKALLAEQPGRPQAIPEEIKPELVHYILDLYVRHTKIGVAQQRACERFGLSLRSVQDVWKHREKYLGVHPPKALTEILQPLLAGE